MRITLESKRVRKGKHQLVNGWRWDLVFRTWSFYQCELPVEASRVEWIRECEWTGNTRKEYKQHLKEHHGNV